MTKTVRIENADTSPYKVKITIQEKLFEKDKDDKWADTGTWKDVKVSEINHPTALFSDYLTTTRRFIVEENGVNT